MLYFVDFVKLVNQVKCLVEYATSTVESTLALDACIDALRWYDSQLGCYLDWAAAEALSLASFADCLGF